MDSEEPKIVTFKGMGLMNRLANSSNKHQGPFKRVLCVCSAGLLRSPTIAWVLSNEPFNCNVRVAGINDDYALVPVDQVLLTWADAVVCAQKEHCEKIHELLEKFELTGDVDVHCLNVPDEFPFRAPALVALIKEALARIDFKGTLQ